MTRPLLRCLALVLATAPVSCLAADPLAHLLACRAVAQAAARLACFDHESARLAAMRAHRARHASLAPRRTFGLPPGVIDARAIAAGMQPKPRSHLSARITGITRAADGRVIFELGNGQMWIELEEHPNLLAKPGETVKISRQLLGSYWMQLSSGRGCKVTRVR